MNVPHLVLVAAERIVAPGAAVVVIPSWLTWVCLVISLGYTADSAATRDRAAAYRRGARPRRDRDWTPPAHPRAGQRLDRRNRVSVRIVDGYEPDPAHVDLAVGMLRAAVRGRAEQVAAALAAIVRAGPEAVATMLYVAADAVIQASEQAFGRLPDDLGAVIGPAWLDRDSLRVITDADEVPPPDRWVGRFVSARAMGDRAQCEALLCTLRGPDAAAHIARLIEATAASVVRAGGRCGR